MKELLKECVLCPRNCHVNRVINKGFCGEDASLRVARASLHMWEEPCISGAAGSGAIFFSGCSVKCVYCQNNEIALDGKGKRLTVSQLSDLFMLMQDKGAANINLVTPTHFAPQIACAIRRAKTEGLVLPVVYNTSGYEKAETLQMLDGLVDIYLPDLKYYSSELSARYSNAPDYFDKASIAIKEMVRQAGSPVFCSEYMKRGVIVRHMVLPGCTKDSKAVVEYLHRTYGDKIYISIMNQYTPHGKLHNFSEIGRRVTSREYKRVVDYAIEIGIVNAFIQEGAAAEESFIPDFDNDVFLSEILGKC